MVITQLTKFHAVLQHDHQEIVINDQIEYNILLEVTNHYENINKSYSITQLHDRICYYLYKMNLEQTEIEIQFKSEE